VFWKWDLALDERRGWSFKSRLHNWCVLVQYELTRTHTASNAGLYSRLCFTLFNHSKRQLVTWTVVGLTATKFKPISYADWLGLVRFLIYACPPPLPAGMPWLQCPQQFCDSCARSRSRVHPVTLCMWISDSDCVYLIAVDNILLMLKSTSSKLCIDTLLYSSRIFIRPSRQILGHSHILQGFQTAVGTISYSSESPDK
jgi:hypothetical protein